MAETNDRYDAYGNPFLLHFKQAVEFKVRFALDQDIAISPLLSKAQSGYYGKIHKLLPSAYAETGVFRSPE